MLRCRGVIETWSLRFQTILFLEILMKKNIFALSVAAALAGFAGSAAAGVPFIAAHGANGIAAADVATKFEVNAGGVGHVLLTPYYTVQGGRNTLLNIVNTDTVNGKAVKVRFRGARNSDDVLDFYVFLSPNDVWRARVYQDGDLTRLDIPEDTSCTLPTAVELNDKKHAFKTVRVFNRDQAEVREGYIEFLTAADIVPPGADGKGGALYKATKHDRRGVVSCNMDALTAATKMLSDQDAAKAVGLGFPTTGLIGHWAIVDVAKNTSVSGLNTALQAVTEKGKPGYGNLVVAPQDAVSAPRSWTSADGVGAGTTDPLLTWSAGKPARIKAAHFDFPDLSTPYVHTAKTLDPAGNAAAHQVNQLSSALAVTRVYNEFMTGQSVNLKTDWVFTMPTRRYAVAIDYADGGSLVENAQSAFFSAENVSFKKNGGAPHLEIPLVPDYYDSEERTLNVTTSPADGNVLAGEVTVVSFNEPVGSNTVLGAQIATHSVYPSIQLESITAGWASVPFSNQLVTEGLSQVDDAYKGLGLPVIGYATFTAGNAALGFTWPHRYNK